MESIAYRAGFLAKLAEYEKTAKFRYEMTEEERKAADRAENKLRNERAKALSQRDPISHSPKNIKELLGSTGKKLGYKTLSLGRGLLSGAGVAGIRAGEGLVDLVTGIPGTIDSIVNGQIAGIDGGRGLMGRALGNFHRYADKGVHSLRKWTDDYDYKHRLDSGFNRFVNGVGADTLGSFIGFGGLAGVGRRVAPKLISKAMGKVLPVAFGSLGAYDALTDGQQRQLRERERIYRTLPHEYRGYFDVTSTKYNQENAPTREEYRRYHMPSKNLPTSYSGHIRIPRSWRYDEYGAPVQFKEYGE